MNPLCICFHGTTKENSEVIMRDGFKKGTFFATHLDDAIEFGGDHIFEVMFVRERVPQKWQFTIRRKLHPNRIVRNYSFNQEVLYDNEELRHKIFNSNER